MKLADKIIYVMRWFNSVFFAVLAGVLLAAGNVASTAAFTTAKTEELSGYSIFAVLAAVLMYLSATAAVSAIRPMLKEPYLPLAFASASSLECGTIMLCLRSAAEIASSLTVLLSEKYESEASLIAEACMKGFAVTAAVSFVVAALCVAAFVCLYVKKRK